MTVFKVALVNLVMWTRDHYFPASYAYATWKRLALFFHLPGGWHMDRTPWKCRFGQRYNQDLEVLCEQVNAAAPRFPDGRRLHVSMQTNAVVRPILDGRKR